MFENVKSDSNAYGYNPSTGRHNDPAVYQNVAERIEIASRNMSESASTFLDLLLEDDGILKDFPHIKETNQILSNDFLLEKTLVMIETPVEQIQIKSKRKTSQYKIDKDYCREHGIKPIARSNQVRAMISTEK